ncbi:hypothetical protein F5B22DRAFT_234292 [Xylaria bambusicola]|uniref:uncharacterized protein n=1 Tax=Xylaria bambusicola TaxID=326684 RepID=UPI002008932E|nr:uncharacterized protein F5B22DRAFT_234292 [Xylaria bambusicola]KAI0514580.1 hypothetical protein F5B22DRAFT_234292 [Xylaria bambusicola]
MDSSDDPFDDLLNLEEKYYRDGYEEGLEDGVEAGRIEGYSLGLRKGFEKFAEAGRLQSKAIVWANRIPKYQQRRQRQQDSTSEQQGLAENAENKGKESEISESGARRLPPVQSNSRLEKNIEMLYGLVEPGTLSTNNDDESVNDFDSRVKGAHGKRRIIERVIREGTNGRHPTAFSPPSLKNDNIEDIGKIQSTPEAKSTTT